MFIIFASIACTNFSISCIIWVFWFTSPEFKGKGRDLAFVVTFPRNIIIQNI